MTVDRTPAHLTDVLYLQQGVVRAAGMTRSAGFLPD
jgi:hypothetical protein